MKHLYALITALGIEFSPVPYARDHVRPEQSAVTEYIDGYYGDDEAAEYDAGTDDYSNYGTPYLDEEHSDNGH